jgi:hypothetical protein
MRRPKLSSRRGGRDDATLLVVRVMLPSALSVSLLPNGGSVHYEIRLFGLLKALQSSERSLLLLRVDQVRNSAVAFEIRNYRTTCICAALGSPCQDHRLLSGLLFAGLSPPLSSLTS